VHPGIFFGEFGNHLPGAVATAVVHENHFQIQTPVARGLVDFAEQDGETLTLVIKPG